MAIHYSILACKIPWTEESGRLQPMGSQRDRTEQLSMQHIYHLLFIIYLKYFYGISLVINSYHFHKFMNYL